MSSEQRSGRRFGRRKSGGMTAPASSDDNENQAHLSSGDGLWSSPSADSNALAYSSSAPTSPRRQTTESSDYSTLSPRSKASILTGKISTLFRRDSNKSESVHNTMSGASSGSRSSLPGGSSYGSANVIDHYADEGEQVLDNRVAEIEKRARSNATRKSRVKNMFRRVMQNQNDDEGDEDSDDGDDKSIAAASVVSHASTVHSKRIFYSSHNDDDSDDSYESRVSRLTNGGRDKLPSNATSNSVDVKTILRYRGFSTSVKSLFLDEPLVCASMGCFGLILSNRTEYLLQIRNERRGMLNPRRTSASRKLPSRIVAYGLILTILLMFLTFLIWGFGTGHGLASEYYQGYDYYDESEAGGDAGYYNENNNYGGYDDNVNNGDGYNNDYYNQQYDDYAGGGNDDGNGNQRLMRILQKNLTMSQDTRFFHSANGIFKLRDTHERLWIPVMDFVKDEWYRDGEWVQSSEGIQRREQSSSYYDVVGDAQQEAEYTIHQRDIGSTARVVLLFAFLLLLGILGRRRRMRTRFYLVRARAQEDHLYYASSDVGASKKVAFDSTRENQYEGACTHTLCGCYPIDDTAEDGEDGEQVEVTDDGIFRRKKKRYNEDFVARGFNCFMASCCGVLCRCWFQCLSICALAQEAREIRLLLPPRYQRIDFITHQPFHEYEQKLTDLRLGFMGLIQMEKGFAPHYQALSRLSRYIVVIGTLAIFALSMTLLFNPRAAFSWQDAVVLAATFLQSFLVLFIVHWIFHKSDLSLDAVIKLFAAGFMIAVPAAFFFEGLLVNVVLFGAWTVYEILGLAIGEGFTSFIFNHWRIVWIIGELFNAFIVAAVVEELCKYYTFRAVEHPDLVFLTGLDRNEQSEQAVDGGIVKYPFGSHNVEALNKAWSGDSGSLRSYRSRADSKSGRFSRRKGFDDSLLQPIDGKVDPEFKDEVPDVRTRVQQAMAITTGMISVSVGLSCAENMLYVFVLGGAVGSSTDGHRQGDIIQAWIVLFFRSIFPVHSLCAALQSINMIRKFVESTNDSGHRIGVGRIILPAVLVHGSFDAVLMAINVFIETAWDNYLEENDGNVGNGSAYNSVVLNILAWAGIVGVMVLGFMWYYREYRRQRERLMVIDELESRKRNQSGDSSWAARSPKELELV